MKSGPYLMQPESPLVVTRKKIDFLKLAIIIWVVCSVIISIRVFLKPYGHTVFHIYSHAAFNWLNGVSTYQLEPSGEIHRDVYRYCPPVTIMFIPFYFLGDAIGGVAWRLIGIVVFLLAFYRWAFYATNIGKDNQCLGISLILLMPLTLTSFNNGQVNLHMMAALLLGLSLLVEKKYLGAGLALSVGVIFKLFPLFIVFLALLAFSWQFFSGFILGIVLLGIVPFFCQSPNYVCSQYLEWFDALKSGDRSMYILEVAYRDFWLIIRYFNLPVSHEMYRLIQVLTACFVVALIFAARLKGLSLKKLAILVVGLGFSWLTLFGPSTESSTYIILAPGFAIAILEGVKSRLISRWIFSASGVIFFILAIGGGVLADTSKIHAVGFHPMGAFLFFIQYVCFACAWIVNQKAGNPDV